MANDHKDNKLFWPEILRAKGYFWLATRNSIKCKMQKAGDSILWEPEGFWWICVPKKQWANTKEEIQEIEFELKNIWLDSIGDRR